MTGDFPKYFVMNYRRLESEISRYWKVLNNEGDTIYYEGNGWGNKATYHQWDKWINDGLVREVRKEELALLISF